MNSTSHLRKFGLVMAVAFGLFGGLRAAQALRRLQPTETPYDAPDEFAAEEPDFTI